MGLKRYMTGVAIAALLTGTAVAQTAPQQPAAAGCAGGAVWAMTEPARRAAIATPVM